jgi:hypothetical protein
MDPRLGMDEVPVTQDVFDACMERNCNYFYADEKSGRNYTGRFEGVDEVER